MPEDNQTRARPSCTRPTRSTRETWWISGPDGVPGEGALRQARRRRHARHRRPHARRGRAAAEQLGVVVVKAQVKAGGRGKAGGVKLAKTPDEAQEHAEAILGMEIKGLTVNRVLIAPAAAHRGGVLLLLPARPRQPAVPLHRLRRGWRGDRGGRQDQPGRRQADRDRRRHRGRRGQGPRDRRRGRRSPSVLVDQAVRMVQSLWKVFVEEDATLVEVNPLARLAGDKLEALDGKVSLDENAEFRHADHAAFEIKDEADPLEAKAKEKGLNYVKLDGAVGIIGNGAGLVMSTLDVVAYAGEAHGGVKPANFLDIGGGANAQVMADGLDVILHDAAGQERVRQRLRRHHRLRRGRQRHRRRARHPRRRGDQAARRPPRRQQRRRGSPDPRRARTTRWSRWWTPWTARPTRPPSWPTPEDGKKQCRST